MSGTLQYQVLRNVRYLAMSGTSQYQVPRTMKYHAISGTSATGGPVLPPATGGPILPPATGGPILPPATDGLQAADPVVTREEAEPLHSKFATQTWVSREESDTYHAVCSLLQ